jgi:hypothetical protein
MTPHSGFDAEGQFFQFRVFVFVWIGQPYIGKLFGISLFDDFCG